VRDIESLLVAEIVGMDVSDDQEVPGKAQAAALLNNMDREVGIDILQRLEKSDNALATDIRQSMFVFEDLIGVDGRGMQAILKEISSDSLVLALKTASDELKAKIFGNMSSRAAEMMKEDLEAMGPVKLSDVETAQKSIANIALRLQEEGTIVVAGGAGGDIV
jgi:flagellar motor switch protein FliG